MSNLNSLDEAVDGLLGDCEGFGILTEAQCIEVMKNLCVPLCCGAAWGPPLPGDMVLHTTRAITLKPGEMGTTFRVGGRWDVPAGTIFKLTQGPDREYVGFGRAVAVTKIPFDQIPGSLIDKCHTGNNTYQGVLAAMRRSYGELFSEAQETLVLTYERL